MSAALTPPEHEHTAAIDEAARWLAVQHGANQPSPVEPALQRRFGLSPKDACLAIREAALIQGRAM